MQHRSHKSRFVPVALALLSGIAAAVAGSGCSSTPKPLINGCDPTACAKDNQCIGVTVAGKSETTCRLTCSAQTGPQGCPFGYRCDAAGSTAAGAVSYCAALSYAKKITRKPKGQWGNACSPVNGGIENTDCDGAQGFKCFAKQPTDANAFCTTYGCATDNDCPGGFACATINSAPNADVAERSVSETGTACMPRAHCSPCASDLDCGPNVNGTPQKCAPDSTGKTFCAATCDVTANCPDDAFCSDETGLCTPTVGRCSSPKGAGDFCDPCTNDGDCKDGLCVSSDNSTERFCATKSTVPCEVVNDKLVSGCPKAISDNQFTYCSTPPNGIERIPVSYCFGFVPFKTNKPNDGTFVGCYSRSKRK